MLVRNIFTERIDVPKESGEWFIFKKLSWKQLRLASEQATEDQIERVQRMGGETFTAITSIKQDAKDKAAVERAKKRAEDPVNGYDWDKLLEMGLHKWSYTEAVQDKSDAAAVPEHQPIEITDTTRGELDDATAEWAVRQILGFSKTEKTEGED